MSPPMNRPRLTAKDDKKDKKNSGSLLKLLAGVVRAVVFAAVLGGFGLFIAFRKWDELKPLASNPPAQAPPGSAVANVPAGPASVPSPAPSPAASTPPTVQPVPPSADSLQNIELTTAASIQRQQLIGSKFKQRQAVASFEEIRRAVDEWEAELARWEKLGPPLLKSDEGKRIAADPNLVARYRAIASLDRPGRDAIAEARKQAEELITPIREASNNPDDASAPEEKITTALRELQAQARKARDVYREACGTVEGLLALAPAAGDAAGKTLEQAMAALDQEEAMKRADFIAAEERKAKEDGAKLVAAEKQKLASIEAEMEAGRIRDLAEQKRQGLLCSGSRWKGTYHTGAADCPATLVIVKRDKDAIEGTIRWDYFGRKDTLVFAGVVAGNNITIKETKTIEGNALPGYIHRALYDPFQRTISGTYTKEGQMAGGFAFRLAAADEE